jgi:hypothetical protein
MKVGTVAQTQLACIWCKNRNHSYKNGLLIFKFYTLIALIKTQTVQKNHFFSFFFLNMPQINHILSKFMQLIYLNLLPLYFRELIKDMVNTVKSDTFQLKQLLSLQLFAAIFLFKLKVLIKLK